MLLAWDGVPYDVPLWRELVVHPDHHVSFQYALYSAPSTTCPPGTRLEVRGDRSLVKLYRRGELIKVHPRQPQGRRSTDPDDYPQERTAYALRAPDRLIRQALPGVGLTHVPNPPSAVPVKRSHQYFLVTQSGPEWDAVVRARNLAAYVSTEVTDPQLELVLILPAE